MSWKLWTSTFCRYSENWMQTYFFFAIYLFSEENNLPFIVYIFSHSLAINVPSQCYPYYCLPTPLNHKASYSQIPGVTISNKSAFLLHSTNQSTVGCWTLNVIVILSFRPSAAQPAYYPITTAIRRLCYRVRVAQQGVSALSLSSVPSMFSFSTIFIRLHSGKMFQNSLIVNLRKYDLTLISHFCIFKSNM